MGPTCLSSTEPSYPSVFRTHIYNCEHFSTKPASSIIAPHGSPDLFIEHADDDLLDMSKDGAEFMKIVTRGIKVNEKGKIEIPLPIKKDCHSPRNQAAVYHRSFNTLQRLKRDPQKFTKCAQIIDSCLERGYVNKELSHNEVKDAETFIPVFPVVNEKKGKVRLVFDSSAKFHGSCLNDCLLQGPDDTIRLIGVLMRFRHHPHSVLSGY